MEADFDANAGADLRLQLLCQTRRHRAAPPAGVAGCGQSGHGRQCRGRGRFWQLCRLARAGFTTDDHHLMLGDQLAISARRSLTGRSDWNSGLGSLSRRAATAACDCASKAPRSACSFCFFSPLERSNSRRGRPRRRLASAVRKSGERSSCARRLREGVAMGPHYIRPPGQNRRLPPGQPSSPGHGENDPTRKSQPPRFSPLGPRIRMRPRGSSRRVRGSSAGSGLRSGCTVVQGRLSGALFPQSLGVFQTQFGWRPRLLSAGTMRSRGGNLNCSADARGRFLN